MFKDGVKIPCYQAEVVSEQISEELVIKLVVEVVNTVSIAQYVLLLYQA